MAGIVAFLAVLKKGWLVTWGQSPDLPREESGLQCEPIHPAIVGKQRRLDRGASVKPEPIGKRRIGGDRNVGLEAGAVDTA
jgi:hypothetical protein